MLYFDCNAAVPLHPAARQAWLDVMERHWHNPSGLYAAASDARDILEDCRERLADRLGCDPRRVIFTAGATAAANLLARHVGATAGTDAAAILSAIEHPCVGESFAAALPGRVEEIPVDRHGAVLIEWLADRLSHRLPPPAIVSVMAASNESGVLQPWPSIAELCRQHRVPFHTDAAQWLGKMPAHGLGECDWVSGSGHKLGGPRGIGFLMVPAATTNFHGDRGGPQEAGRQAGTENLAAIAALVAAIEARERDIAAGNDIRVTARDTAEQRLRERLPGAVIIGTGAARLWNTLAVVVPGSDGRKLVGRLDRAGIAASTGSACSAGSDSTARVLAAIGATDLGIAPTDSQGMIRLSGSWETTAAEWVAAADALADAVTGKTAGPPRISLSDAGQVGPPAPAPPR